ncbi:Cell wall mannoprotein 1 [Metarhizium anisopliae]|nr:Cell wall mannoprotein 1 [Metarhizium anisopliae]
MKFLALTTLASGAYAGVLVQRDLATIQAAMTSAGQGIDGLGTAIKGFSGDPAPVLAASNTLIQALKDGKAKVDPSSDLTLADALGLQAPAGDLQKKGDALLADLKTAVPTIEKAGMCEVTFTQTSDINTAAKALIDSVVSKVPTAAQGIAQGIVAGLLKDLQDAQDAVGPANCKNSATPPASSSAAPPATSAAPPSSSAAPPATSEAPPATTQAPPSSSAAPPATTGAPPVTSAAPPASDTCPAASTVTVTAIDSKHCTPTPTCTKKPPVTVTTTKKACPTKTKLPW